MNPKMIWANVAVNDLERTTKFYTALGFKSNSSSNKLTSFFVGVNNFVKHFFLKDSLQKEIKGALADLTKGNEIIFTLSAGSKQDVDQWAIEVQQAGGNLVSHPEEFGAGYYGFVFADPDGHKFNVFYMKGL